MVNLSPLETLVSVGKYSQSHFDILETFLSAMEPFQADPVVDISYHQVVVGPRASREYTEDKSRVEYVQLSWYNAGVTLEISDKRIILFLTEIHPIKSIPVSALYRDITDSKVVPVMRNLATSWAEIQSMRNTFGEDDSDDESS